MLKARPPFVRGDIVTTKDNNRQIILTGYGNDPEKESQMKHANQTGEDKKVVNGYYPDDEKKTEHWWHEEDLKFVRSA
jgi:hypothetical protein